MLVVFGHLLERRLGHDEVARFIYTWIYLFHMPAFALLAGLTSRGASQAGFGEKSIVRVLAPLVVFTALYEGAYRIAKGQWSDYIQGYQPYWILWFLVSLLCWRAMLPWILRIPGGHRWGWAVAVVIALIAGSFESIGYGFGLSRTLYFLPFFLLGHRLQDSGSRLIVGPWLLAAAVSGACALVIWWLGRTIAPSWLYGSNGYAAFGMANLHGTIARAATFLLSALGGWAFFRLVPTQLGPITRFGERSLSIFLWHGLLVRWLAPDRLGLDFGSGASAAVGSLAVALAISWGLSSDLVWRFTRHALLDPAAAVLLGLARSLRPVSA